MKRDRVSVDVKWVRRGGGSVWSPGSGSETWWRKGPSPTSADVSPSHRSPPPPGTLKSVWRLPLCVSPAALVAAGTAGEKEAAASLRMLNEVRSGDGRHDDFSSVEILSGECLRFILPFGSQLHTDAKLIERFFVFLIIIICLNLLPLEWSRWSRV